MPSAPGARIRPATCQPLQPNSSVRPVADSRRQRSYQRKSSLTSAKPVIVSDLRRCDDVYSTTPLRSECLLLHWALHRGIPSVHFGTFRRQLTSDLANLHSLTIRDPSLEYGTRLELSPRVSTQEHLREKFRLAVCTDACCRNSIAQRLLWLSAFSGSAGDIRYCKDDVNTPWLA